ncbi:MAG: divalent metal cation transporter [Calditrichaeota bacterium]|nr:divalent metal cation transporter [Calditrichota bacterium]
MKPEKLKSRAVSLWGRMMIFFAVMGPGIITANVDNDAGGITTYSQAGAHFGLKTLWIFIPMMLALIMVQEMVNRMGVVTGKGLSDLIRERFGVRWTFYLMLALLITNFGNIIAEFSGVAAAGELLGIPRWVSVPLAGIAVWGLVLAGTYAIVEKVFLVATLFYVAYIIAGFRVGADWGEVGRALVTPELVPDTAYILMLIGLLGTTIAPWMQFYQQASVAEKNIKLKDYKYSRLDTILGGIVVCVVALFIVVVCAQILHQNNIRIETAGQAAQALAPLAGRFSALLFAVGLLNASLFAASILPLSTSYTICEGFGWETGLDKKFHEARQFYILYTALIVVGVLVVLKPNLPLVQVMFLSQVLNGVVLPIVLFPMLILVNDRRLMGEHVNGLVYNIICWALAVGLVALSVTYVVGAFL